MQALKDDVTLDLGDEDAWMWVWFVGWTVGAGVIAGSIFTDGTGEFGWQAFLVGAVVGAILTVPTVMLLHVAARRLTRGKTTTTASSPGSPGATPPAA